MPPSMDPLKLPSPPADANSRHDEQPQTEKPFRFLDLPKELRLESTSQKPLPRWHFAMHYQQALFYYTWPFLRAFN
jgi:hypothetical protein